MNRYYGITSTKEFHTHCWFFHVHVCLDEILIIIILDFCYRSHMSFIPAKSWPLRTCTAGRISVLPALPLIHYRVLDQKRWKPSSATISVSFRDLRRREIRLCDARNMKHFPCGFYRVFFVFLLLLFFTMGEQDPHRKFQQLSRVLPNLHEFFLFKKTLTLQKVSERSPVCKSLNLSQWYDIWDRFERYVASKICLFMLQWTHHSTVYSVHSADRKSNTSVEMFFYRN